MHTASRRVIDHLVDRSIGTLVIGYNPNWKQQVRIGRVNNQKFVSIPHAMLVDMLTYKAELAGMKVVLQEESYTSKCSFLDREYPQKREQYAGRRIHRGLFRAGDETLVNADVNGSYNIIRKAFPKAFEGIEGVVVHPVRVPPS
jgi:putative transposase